MRPSSGIQFPPVKAIWIYENSKLADMAVAEDGHPLDFEDTV
jgi:hypothetical protein